MRQWKKVAVSIRMDGCRDITYAAPGVSCQIESRRRMIPHASGSGSWAYTSFFVIWPDGREKECHRLQDAKRIAEGAER